MVIILLTKQQHKSVKRKINKSTCVQAYGWYSSSGMLPLYGDFTIFKGPKRKIISKETKTKKNLVEEIANTVLHKQPSKVRNA